MRIAVLKIALVLSLCWLTVSVASVAQAQTSAGRTGLSSFVSIYAVPVQPVSDALIAFAIQANLSIGFNGLDLSGISNAGIKGTYTAYDALGQMLRGTGLGFEYIDQTTVRIFKLEQRVARAPARPTVTPRVMDVRENTVVLEELIVTSTKRARDPQKLPLGVSVVSGNRLNNMRTKDTLDLSAQVVGLAVTNQGPGRNKIFLRGQSDGPLAERTQSTVGIYVDDAPLVFSDTNPDFRLVDIERLEVIRGPQGTLYGSGSLSGTYRIITNKPNPTAFYGGGSGSLSTTQDGRPSGSLDGFVNVPLLDDVAAVRFAGFYDYFGGFIDDVRLDEENVNSGRIYGGRFAFRTDLGENWQATLSANGQRIDLEDTQYFVSQVGILQRDNFVAEPRRDDIFQVAVTAEGTLGEVNVLATASYVNRDIHNVSDASLAVPGLTGLELRPSPFEKQNTISTFSQEIRFSGTSKKLDWLVGGFHLGRTEDLRSTLNVPGAGDVLGDLGFPSDVVFREERDDDVQQFAVFLDGTYNVSSRLDISAGLRWSRSSLDVTSLTTGFISDGGPELDLQNNKTAYAPKVAVSFHATQTTTWYAHAAKGFRVGGVNLNTPVSALFDPGLDPDETLATQTFTSDSLWNYEVGVKGRYFDNRLEINAAAFYVDWSDIQTDQLLPSGFLFVTNAGSARNFGFEVQVAYKPSRALDVNLVGFWNDPELTQANGFLGAEAGNQLPNISEYSVGLSAQYSWALSSKLSAFVNGDYAYVGPSRLFFNEESSPEMGDYHKAGLRAGVEGDSWSALLYVDNVLNEKGNTFSFGNGFSFQNSSQFTPLRPRAFGLSVSRTF